MINQVVPNSAPKIGAYTDFSQPKTGWYLGTQDIVDIKKEDEKKEKKYGKSIVIGALVVGFGTLALMKGGFSKTFTKHLDKLRTKLELKSAKGGNLSGFYRSVSKHITSFIKKSESINNLTTLKDVLFAKLMFGTKFTERIHKGITRGFDKLARNTVNSSYANTSKKFANLNEYMTNLNEKILEQNPNNKDAIERINARILRVNDAYEKGFGINARNSRLARLKTACEGLFDYFWGKSFKDYRNFGSKNMYQTFIAEGYMLPHKVDIQGDVGLLRQAFTHDINDTYKATSNALDNIKKFVNPYDAQTNEILTKLRGKLRDYKDLSGNDELIQREKICREITEHLQELSSVYERQARTHGYNQDAVSSLADYIKEVKSLIKNSQKGELQEILTEYKKILPRREYLKLRAKVQEAINSLDSSIETETVKYTDKARDLVLGSAPTDVLSILFGVGTVGWFLGKSKDKDERTSAAIKYGIPAIGAIATSLYGTAKLISGGKSMALGLLSGWIMNRIGVQIDNFRKQYDIDLSLQNKNFIAQQ